MKKQMLILMNCSECGNRNKIGTKFCPKCGKKYSFAEMDIVKKVYALISNLMEKKYTIILIILGIGFIMSLGKCAIEKEKEIPEHVCVWTSGTCLELQVCTVCGETNNEYGEHSIESNGNCKYCQENQDVELTLSNWEDYLSATSAYGFGRCEIEVAGKNAKYIDVVVTFQVDFEHTLGFKSLDIVEVKLDKSGYGKELAHPDAPGIPGAGATAVTNYSVSIVDVKGKVRKIQ